MNTDELVEIRSTLKLTQDAFSSLAGVTLRTVQNWEAGKTIPKSKHDFLNKLLQEHYTKSLNNSLTNNDGLTEELTNKNGNRFIELKNGKYKIIVKKVPVKAFGSYLTDFQSSHFMEELEEVMFTVDHLGRGKYFCFECEGESMNGGQIDDTPDGAELLCRELSRQHWKDGFRISKYGWVIVHDKTVLFKDIKSLDSTTGNIVCSSRSGLPNHPDFTVNLNEIKQILKVIKRTF